MTSQIAKIEPSQLEEVVKNSGLAIQEGEEIKKSYQPYLIQLAQIQSEAGKINYDEPTSTDEVIARELRLKAVKVRTSAADLKDSRKRTYLLRGNLEQAAYNLIAASCKLTEDVFVQVEKAKEIADAKRRAELKAERDQEMLTYAEFLPSGLDFGKMTDEDYARLLQTVKVQQKMKLDAEEKAEKERQAAEAERLAEEKRIREENERLRKEAKAADERARVEREAAEAKLKAEREAREKAEAEIRAKAEAEKKAADERARVEKKAAAAPDKQKLITLSATISGMQFPEMKTIEGMAVLNSVKELLKKTTDFITKKVEEI
jgi:hypothetical protein